MAAIKQKMPFAFVLESLDSLAPVVRPMFGCYAVYVRNKLVLMLRNRADFTLDNGVWLALKQEHRSELQRIFPSMRSISLFGNKKTNWHVIPMESDNFEEAVMRACELILQHDPRIGKVPKARKTKN